MNEIALANFYRVLNAADRFPTEKELAEAAIAAKEELNTLRAQSFSVNQGAEALAEEIWRRVFGSNGSKHIKPEDIEHIIRKHSGWRPPVAEASPPARAMDARAAITAAWEVFDLVIKAHDNKASCGVDDIAAILRHHFAQEAGWVMVPKKATEKMMRAGYIKLTVNIEDNGHDLYDAWEAMIAAAPGSHEEKT